MLTELVFILDRSGSMNGLENDTIGGFNSLLEKQKAAEDDVYVTTVLFDHKYELLYDRVNIKDVESITHKEYYVRGTTALLDAVGITINKIKELQKYHQSDKVLFVIITDGYENASSEFTYEKIKAMINQQKEKANWEFIFLGANIDAINVANRIGIEKNKAANFHADSEGVKLNFTVLNKTISNFRSKQRITDNWKELIDADYISRKKDLEGK